MIPMMRAVLEMAAFLELSSDDVIDPAAAVAQLEQMSFFLKGLSPAERDVFLGFVEQRAAADRADPSRQQYADFLDQFPDAMGLLPEVGETEESR